MNQHASTATAKRGILLIATGQPYYVQSAFNLALSLKANDMLCNIHLITDGCIDWLNDTQKYLFNTIQRMDGVNPFQLKTQLYSLSPFDQTLFLDVDMIWNPAGSLREFMNTLTGIPFTIANRGLITTEWDWGDAAVFKQHCGSDAVYNLSSELIYFERSDAVVELFDKAQHFYANNQIIQRRLGGYQPDEPSLSYAMHSTGIKPHVSPWLPCFWVNNQKNEYISDKAIQDRYQSVSMGGSQMEPRIVKIYNRYAAIAADKMGIKAMPYFQKKLQVKSRAIV